MSPGKLDFHPKVAGGTLAGAVALIVLYGLGFALDNIPYEVAGAVTLICATIGGYFAPWFSANQPGVPHPKRRRR